MSGLNDWGRGGRYVDTELMQGRHRSHKIRAWWPAQTATMFTAPIHTSTLFSVFHCNQWEYLGVRDRKEQKNVCIWGCINCTLRQKLLGWTDEARRDGKEIVSWCGRLKRRSEVQLQNLKGRNILRKVRLGGVRMLKWILRKHGMGTDTGSIYFGIRFLNTIRTCWNSCFIKGGGSD